MLINSILLFAGLIIMLLKGYSVISVNPELILLIGFGLIIPNLFFIMWKALKTKSSEKLIRN